MEFNLIKFTPTQRYSRIIDPNERPRYICFGQRDIAQKCVKDICMYRSKYGTWPEVDFTKKITTVKMKETRKERKPEELEKFMMIETFDEVQLENLSKCFNMQFFYCTEFKLFSETNNTLSLAIRGSDVEIPSDEALFKGQLEMNLKLR